MMHGTINIKNCTQIVCSLCSNECINVLDVVSSKVLIVAHFVRCGVWRWSGSDHGDEAEPQRTGEGSYARNVLCPRG